MKRKNIILVILSIAIILATALTIMLTTIDCNPENPPKVIIDQSKIELLVGEEYTLKAQTIQKDATVSWQSSNVAIASVENGVVKAETVGTCVVSAYFDGEKAECIVEVISNSQKNAIGYKIIAQTGNLNLAFGQKFTLNPILYDNSGKAVSATFTYSSNNETIATVSEIGEIEGKSSGTAQVTIKYQNGNDFVTTIVNIVVQDEWKVVVEPIVNVQTSSEYPIVYKVYKNGNLYDYDTQKVSIYTQDESVATVENGKLKTKDKSGYIALYVLLNDINVKGIVNVAVIDPSAESINLGLKDFTVYTNSSCQVPITGASWGTFKYVTSNVNFKVENGILFAPSSEGSSTLTVVHLETNQSISATVKAIDFTPCITSADQLIALSNYNTTEDVYLGADIDLTEIAWTKEDSFSYARTHTNGVVQNATINNVSYLIKKLSVNLDGRGHKIKVKYTATGTHTTIAGLFGVVDKATVENLVYEISVNANSGKNGANDTYPAGFCQVLRGATIKNCFLKAEYKYTTTASNRVYMFRRAHNSSMIENCVIDISVKQGSSAISTGGIVMENISQEDPSHCSLVKNCVLLNAGNVAFSGEYYLGSKSYLNIDAFADDWTEGTIPDKQSYTKWDLASDGDNFNLKFDNRVVNTYSSGRFYVDSASKFMQIGSVNGKQIVLTRDIDLTQEGWTYEGSFVHAWTNQNGTPNSSTLSKITYLVRDLHASIDGKGYKITASYNQASVNDHGLPAIIGAIHKGVKIENLAVDFTMTATASAHANFYGALAINADGTTIKNCFIKGRFNFASGAAYNDLKRASVIGRSTNYTVIENCIADMQVTVGGVNQDAGNYWWTNNGNLGKLTNSTIINPTTMDVASVGKTGVSYYSSIANFISAWEENTVINQSTYTAWSVENGNIKLKGKTVA